MEIPITPSELSAFGSFLSGLGITPSELSAFGGFLSGLGAILLALFAFHGVNRWKEQAIFKDEFDLAIKVVEVVCKVEAAIFDLESSIESVHLSKNAEYVLTKSLPTLKSVIKELRASAVSAEALFTKGEASSLQNITIFCQKVEYTTQFFYESIINYNEAIESLTKSKECLSGLQKKLLEMRELFADITLVSVNLPKVNKEIFESYYEYLEQARKSEVIITKQEETIKLSKIIIDEHNKHFTWQYSEDLTKRNGPTFSVDFIPLSHAIKELMQPYFKRN
jgi:hypothetical protein